MTTTRRRAILAAVVGAFAQVAEAQKPKQQKPAESDYGAVLMDIGEKTRSTALSLTIDTKAQKIIGIDVTVDGETVEITTAELMDAIRPHKPKNNECPVCGTIEEAFHKPPEWNQYPSGYIERDADGKMRPVNIARCKNCSAAFWQDAE